METTRWILRILNSLPGGKTIAYLVFNEDYSSLHREVLGLRFNSPIGVGGGIDPAGRYFGLFGHLGTAFDIIGPVTSENAISTIRNFQDCKSECNPFVCITNNKKSVEDEELTKDFADCFSLVYDFAPLFVIDLSSPMLEQDLVRDIITAILDIRFTYEEYKPVIIKLGEHLTENELDSLTDFCRMSNVDALMCCTEKMVSHVFIHTKGRLPIIGYGGLNKSGAVLDMLNSGASLVCLESELKSKGLFFITHLKRQLSYLIHNGKLRSE